jgi:hypothetical protein
VTDAAPRVPQRLWEALARIDDGTMPIAEVRRRLGAVADAHGLARPSYQTVRRLVHQTRRWKARPTTAEVLVDVALRARPVDAFLDHLVDDLPPRRRS